MKKLIDFSIQQNNANAHTPRGMGALEGSIQKDGWIGAITVAADGETFDGSARLEVGARTGFDEVEPIVVESDGSRPVIVKRTDIPTADDERAVRLGISANRVAELNLSWSPDVLTGLADDGVDLSNLFYPDELAALLEEAQTEETQTDDDATPVIDENKPTRCQPGDVWRVGGHIIACLDSTVRENVERLIAGREVGMVVADPPYGINIVSTTGFVGGGAEYHLPFGGIRHNGLGSTNGAKPFGKVGTISRGMKAKPIIQQGLYAPVAGDDSIAAAVNGSAIALKLYPKATHFWWGANNYAHALPPSTCWIVWDKDNGESFFADAELAWSNHDSAVRIFKHMWNGLMKESERGERRTHPTQKPIALFQWLYEKYGSAGDFILDPFLGSGPSLKAAHRMGDGRRVIGFELSPHYIDHILSWAEAEGLTCERVE